MGDTNNSNDDTPINSPLSPNSQVSTLSKRKYYTRSDVWNHFTKSESTTGDRSVVARCNYCNAEYACKSTNGTSTMTAHLGKCRKYPYDNDRTQKLLSFKASGTNGDSVSLIPWKFDQELCRQAFTRMIIIDELPFKFVEHEGFRSFMSVAQPMFRLLTRTTVAKDCMLMYTIEREKLKTFLKNSVDRVSLTTDLWTSLQNISYMCLTAHFIDKDWKLHKRIINFCVVTSHKGEAIGKAVELCLIEWGIENVCTITVDNASSNDVAVGYLKKKLNKNNGCILNGEFLHVRCCAHILNLIVRDGMNDVQDSIIRIRGAVKYIRSSPARAEQFRTCVEQERIKSKSALVLDVSTRWNSSYLMLDTALKYQKAFERLEELEPQFEKELKEGAPTDTDWHYAQVLAKFLLTFYNTSNRLSGSLYVTSNSYFHEICGIESTISEWSKSEDPFLSSMSKKMKEKFDKYWGNIDKVNLMILLAVVLDPCFKLRYVKFCYMKVYPTSKVDELICRIKETMLRIFQYYQIHENVLLVSNSTHSSSEIEVGQLSDACAPTKNLQSEFEKHMEVEDNMDAKCEVDKYLEESIEKKNEQFDILYWWKINSSRFPILSKVARDILAIPVSTVASESAFSTGGRVLDQFRSSLTPKIVQCLICGQDWLRASRVPINIEEDLEELEDLDSCITEEINYPGV